VAGLRFGSGEAGIPPTPPFRLALASDGSFFGGFGVRILPSKMRARVDVALDPPNPCAGNDKELPKDSFTILEKLVIIIVSRKNALYYILYTIMLNNYERYVKQ